MRTLLIALALCLPLAAQTPLPDQIVAGGATFDQASTPAIRGFVGYAKKISGIYEFSKIEITQIKLSPQPQIQTTTETGICAPFGQSLGFALLGCGTGGLANTGANLGFSGSGTVMAVKPIGRRFWAGAFAGPSYSAVADKVAYRFGVVVGWGK